MSRQIICDGDTLVFIPTFGHRTITNIISPAVIRGSGLATVNGKKICVLGDEQNVRLQAQYSVPGHGPGIGTLSIARVKEDQKTPLIGSTRPMLVKGQMFEALFTPTQAAIKPGPTPTPDPATPSSGQGQFVPAQAFATAGS